MASVSTFVGAGGIFEDGGADSSKHHHGWVAASNDVLVSRCNQIL
jgi:hypothetical protein